MAKTRNCKVCGKAYRYCPTCYEDRFKPSWMQLFCGENCKEIWNILTEVGIGSLDKEEAAVQLQALDLSGLETFVPAIRDQIKDILGMNKEQKKAKSKATAEEE